MSLLLHWFITAIAVIISAYILPGIRVTNFTTALVAALVLGVLNAFIKPLLIILTLPVNILTLGLFTLVINALIVLMAARIVPDFQVDGFISALLFSIVLSIINALLIDIT